MISGSLYEVMTNVPKSVHGNTPWAEAYGREMKALVIDYASRAPRSLQRHLGPSELGEPCLEYNTVVVTRTGLRRIGELAEEGHAELLIPMTYEDSDIRKKWGHFQDVPVSCFGEQRLFRIILRRNQERKEVLATAEHKWFRSYWSGKAKKQKVLTTADLRTGHKLTQLRRAMPVSTTLMPVAVAQGFTFGDGTKGSSDSKHRPATLCLYHNGKDEALLPFFPDEHKVYKNADHKHAHSIVRGLPRFWKKLPPLEDSTSFLMSWLAGYFAADGCVTEDGHASVSSANPANLEFVRSLAAICGVGYGQVTKSMRVGINQEQETALYKLSLRRRDLPPWFFLTSRHRERALLANNAQERDPHWTVESVAPTSRTEPVYCATVPGIGAFALADDLMTGNCDRQVVAKMAGVARERSVNHVSDPWASIMGTAGHSWVEGMYKWDNVRRAEQDAPYRWIPETRVTPDPELGENAHPGTADLYDAQNLALVDHKFLGTTSRSKLISAGKPKRLYYVQLLLYRRGYVNLGFPVQRIVLLAWPRDKSTMDEMYVWEHTPTPEDDALCDEVLARTKDRQDLAQLVRGGLVDPLAVNATPSDDSCFYCPLYRPQAAHGGTWGCPGTLMIKKG